MTTPADHGINAAKCDNIANDLERRRDADKKFAREYDFGGFTVKKTKTGFVVRRWSTVAGTLTDTAHLLPYGTCGIDRDWNLHQLVTRYATAGQLLYNALQDGAPAKTLRRGRIVR